MNTKRITDYLEKYNINYTIDKNPSKEKIARIEAIIKIKKIKEDLIKKFWK